MGIFGGASLNAAFGKDKPDLRQVSVIKNDALQKLIDSGIGSLGDTQTSAEKAIADYTAQWAKTRPDIERYTMSGIDQINRLFTPGGVEADLANLRTGEIAAREGATQQILNRIQAQDLARRARTGVIGGNTNLDLASARLMRDTRIDSAMQDAAQKRADYNALLQARLANPTTRQQLLESLTASVNQPFQNKYATRGQVMSQIAGMEQIDQANKWQGLYKKRDWMQRFADTDEQMTSDIMDAISIASSVMGMVSGMPGMGGGATKGNAGVQGTFGKPVAMGSGNWGTVGSTMGPTAAAGAAAWG